MMMFKAVRGFAMLSMTLILVFLTISSSLAFAHMQQQRIHRNQLDLNYLRAKIIAANKLDLFYIVIYDSPELLTLLQPCTNLALDNHQRVTPNAMMQQYMLSEPFYLCVEKAAVFNITIAITYNNTERLVMQRQLVTTSMPWTWQPSSLYGV
ncbi:hypothetical protein [Moritella sp. Urea-trap-13]|uniref:hypothetical protein n=1 Tax=Moritella sp. Urea-trap-13 TaxID=2058327 RepID=UPI000C32D4AD|nr:hypothetical protein [Moritella sp. Urea-trap-13]PKH04719.1 hypothetical protein CXF93_21115 [Moritella sp. Urea-trap-13]